MREPRPIALEFPVAGMDKNWSKRGQSEKTTIDCQNVRGYEYDERARGGQRSGMSKYTDTALESGARIQVLTSLIRIPATAQTPSKMNARTTRLLTVCNGVHYQVDIDGTAFDSNNDGTYTPVAPASGTDNLMHPSAPFIGTGNLLGKVYFVDGNLPTYYDASVDTIYSWPKEVIDNGSGTFPEQEIVAAATIDTVARSSGTSTLVMDAAHGFTAGHTVYVAGQDTTFSGFFRILTQDGDKTFTYSQPTAGDVGSKSDTGTAKTVWMPRLVASWRGRMVLAGLPGADSHNWFMAKKDDPLDFDYSPTVITEIQPIAGNSSNAGRMGQVINCLLQFSDDILLFGCDSSIWQLSGDPMVGGRFDMISDVTGMAFGAPYCKDPDGTLYFMGSRGHIYSMEAGAQKSLKNLTSMRLPSDFQDLNLDDNRVELQWDDEDQGVRVFIIPLADKEATGWFYSARLDAWYKDKFETTRRPMCTYVIDGDAAADRKLITGHEDGYVRYFDSNSDEDDGVAINSYVFMGPFQAERGQYPFILQSLQMVLAKDSDDVSFKVYVGNSAEDAANVTGYLLLESYGRLTLQTGGFVSLQGATDETHTDIFSGDFSVTRSITHHPRQRGYAAYVKLYNNGNDEKWSMETLRAKLQVISTSRQRQLT